MIWDDATSPAANTKGANGTDEIELPLSDLCLQLDPDSA